MRAKLRRLCVHIKAQPYILDLISPNTFPSIHIAAALGVPLPRQGCRSLISTAVIRGSRDDCQSSSSAPDINRLIEDHVALVTPTPAAVSPDDMLVPTAPCVPEVYPLETLHNSLTLSQLEAFLARLAFVKLPTPFTSPHCPSTPVSQRFSRQRSGPTPTVVPTPSTTAVSSASHVNPGSISSSNLMQLLRQLNTAHSQANTTTPGNESTHVLGPGDERVVHLLPANSDPIFLGQQSRVPVAAGQRCVLGRPREFSSDNRGNSSYAEFDSLASNLSYLGLCFSKQVSINDIHDQHFQHQPYNTQKQHLSTEISFTGSTGMESNENLFHLAADSTEPHENRGSMDGGLDWWPGPTSNVLPGQSAVPLSWTLQMSGARSTDEPTTLISASFGTATSNTTDSKDDTNQAFRFGVSPPQQLLAVAAVETNASARTTTTLLTIEHGSDVAESASSDAKKCHIHPGRIFTRDTHDLYGGEEEKERCGEGN
ncbi:unnamed protein product [Protopolystoma xenopodis]|uniref:Uncharacterized protein n=1 Tax=Protopolystoma xenopodis TaxID=117903 RepID=A0A448XBG9_9PLAT|nr:unnamed protein product [Protopolystoma xenopodis]